MTGEAISRGLLDTNIVVYLPVLAAGRTPRRRIADLMIAAIAIVSRLPLYTTSPDDFTGLDHLLTINAVQRPRTTAHP
ncbi:MAG TPA: hypothetical protein VFM37_07405 [Pseudonocardiaceae bacterium]|nr:hypothetical protein [Pseudonocardiaceae bacterium]